MFSFWTKLLLIRSIELPLSTINRKSHSLPPICKWPRTFICVARVVVKAVAAVARSFFFAGALHRVVSGGPVLGLGKGPSTPPSCCLFLIVLLDLPVPLVLLLRLVSSSNCSFEGSQSYGGLPGHIQNKHFCLGTFSGPGGLIFYAVSAPTSLCQYSLRQDPLSSVFVKSCSLGAAACCVLAVVCAAYCQFGWPY